MKKGIVKWFHIPKGYGFITGEDGVDVFVHHSGINGTGFKTLHRGQEVTYDVTTDEKGRVMACDIEAVAE